MKSGQLHLDITHKCKYTAGKSAKQRGSALSLDNTGLLGLRSADSMCSIRQRPNAVAAVASLAQGGLSMTQRQTNSGAPWTLTRETPMSHVLVRRLVWPVVGGQRWVELVSSAKPSGKATRHETSTLTAKECIGRPCTRRRLLRPVLGDVSRRQRRPETVW